MTKYAIGIDGGGTSCRAAVADATGRILGRGKAGPANIMSDRTMALENIVASSRSALENAGIDPSCLERSAAVLGVAGANVGPHGSLIREALPFAKAEVVTDQLIALQGALGTSDGVVASFGTGSVYGARRHGKVTEIGGWGFVVGDQASGARLGRDLLELALLSHDGVCAPTPLTRNVMAAFGNEPQNVVEFAHNATPGDFARYAPQVFDHAAAGDAIATRIVRQAASDIDNSLDALLWPDCTTVCLLGGLALAYRAWLSTAHQALLVDPLGDALQGAVSFAVALAWKNERRSA